MCLGSFTCGQGDLTGASTREFLVCPGKGGCPYEPTGYISILFYPPKSQFLGSRAVFRHVHVVNDADDVCSHGRLMSYKSEVMVMNGGCCRISRDIFMSESMDVMLANVHGEGTCSFGQNSSFPTNIKYHPNETPAGCIAFAHLGVPKGHLLILNWGCIPILRIVKPC